jgi:hypothetical protein
MKKNYCALIAMGLLSIFSCDNFEPNADKEIKSATETRQLSAESEPQEENERREPHNYGGWYCPDNLNGFPVVDFSDWADVPVVNGRMATQEDTRNGSSLMFIDMAKYPDAKPMDITTPKLARYYNEYSQNDELIIVIQAVTVENDSVVGFRYINGGNGSARFHEVDFLTDPEVENLKSSRFISQTIAIDAKAKDIYKVITDSIYATRLGEGFYENVIYESDWNRDSKVVVKDVSGDILRTGRLTAVWPSLYIQIDYNFEGVNYVEKLFLSSYEEGESTELILVAGPFNDDFNEQKKSWNSWGYTLKVLSEQRKWIGI